MLGLTIYQAKAATHADLFPDVDFPQRRPSPSRVMRQVVAAGGDVMTCDLLCGSSCSDKVLVNTLDNVTSSPTFIAESSLKLLSGMVITFGPIFPPAGYGRRNCLTGLSRNQDSSHPDRDASLS